MFALECFTARLYALCTTHLFCHTSNYYSTVWHNSSIDHINKLHKLQKRAARVITRSNYDEKLSQIFETLNWKTIKEILDERQLVMTFKALQGPGPEYLTQLFNLNNNTSHQLQGDNRYIHLPKPRTDFLKNSFSYRGAVSWNNLPKNVIDDVIKICHLPHSNLTSLTLT